MESFSETRMEIDLFSYEKSPCPEIDTAISKEQAPETTSSTEKVPDIRNLDRKLRKRANKPKCKNGCSKEESRIVQNMEHERSKNRQQRLKRLGERRWDVMARRSRKLSSRTSKKAKAQTAPKAPRAPTVPKAPKAPKAPRAPKAPKASAVQKAPKNFKRRKPHSKRVQTTTSANNEPLGRGRGSNPWTRWTTPPPGQ